MTGEKRKKGKGERFCFCIVVGLLVFGGLFMAQAMSVASAVEAASYIEFAGAATPEEAAQASFHMGEIIQIQQKKKLAEDGLTKRPLDGTKPMIALTFDDGPNPATTGRILQALEKQGGRGTFFVVGSRVGGNQVILRRMAQGGHQIGNHSYSHKNFAKSSDQTIQNEIAATQNAVFTELGMDNAFAVPRIARIPYGANAKHVGQAVNMPLIQWSVDTKDWSTRSVNKTVNAILGNAKDGDIILMHDLYEQTAAACEKVIPQLVAKGFQLVTVEELFEAKGIPLQPAWVYHYAR